MASQAVTKARVDWAYRQLVDGKPTSRLVAELADREGLSKRRARQLVALAYGQLRADWTDEPVSNEAYLARMIAAAEAAIEQGLRDGHGHVVLGGINALSRLLGIGAEHRPVNPYASKIGGRPGG